MRELESFSLKRNLYLGDVNLKNINNITESGLTDTKNLSPGHLDESQNESPDSKFKPTTVNLNAKADCSKLDV